MQIGELLAGQKAAFGEVHAIFHFALVLGRAWAVGADQETVVLGLPPIRLAENRVVQVRLEDGRLQVVQDDALRDAAEPLEGVAVAGQPGADLLVEDELGVLMTAVAERHDEDPGATRPAADRVEQRPRAAEIHLRFFARSGVHPHHRVRSRWLERVHEAADRRIAARIAAFTEPIEDGHLLYARGEQLLHLGAVRLDGGWRPRWLGRWPQACAQLGRFG
jgi:hypothetical protein